MFELGTTHIPPAMDVNYSDAGEVCGYQWLLCKKYEQAGGFSFPPVANTVTAGIRKQGMVWLREVRTLIDSVLKGTQTGDMTLASVPALLSSYEFLYSVCNGANCRDYVRKTAIRTTERWVKGDRSISQTDVTLLLLREIDLDIRAIDNRYIDFALGVMGSWIEELTYYGEFRNTPCDEAYRRITYLLKKDLALFVGSKEQTTVKSQWVRKFTLSDRDIDSLDTPSLRNYITFVNTAAYLDPDNADTHESPYFHLISKLASRPDLDPYNLQALDLELSSRHPEQLRG